MAREKIAYTNEELTRPANFILVVADKTVDTSIIDIEEAEKYVKHHNRKAAIITDSPAFNNIPEIYFGHLQIWTVPDFKKIKTNQEPYNNVYQLILERYKNGLLIAGENTLTNEIASKLALSKNCGIDFMIYRDNMITISIEERKRINWMRIHKNKNFVFNLGNMAALNDAYGDPEISYGIMLSHYITRYQYETLQQYINDTSQELILTGYTDNIIEKYSYNRQLAYYVYFDLVRKKIHGVDSEKFYDYVEALNEILNIPVNEEETRLIANLYTP